MMRSSTLRSANLAGLSLLMVAPVAAANSNVMKDDRKAPSFIKRLPVEPKIEAAASANIQRPKVFIRDLATRPLQEKIAAFSQLGADWDGAGSVPPSKSAIDGAISFLASLSPAVPLPEVSPAGDGEISMSWRDSEKFIDVSFFSETASAYARVNNRVEKIRAIRHFYELPGDAIEALLGI